MTPTRGLRFSIINQFTWRRYSSWCRCVLLIHVKKKRQRNSFRFSHWLLWDACGQDISSVSSDALELNTPHRACYFLKMNSTLWWGELNASSHFPWSTSLCLGDGSNWGCGQSQYGRSGALLPASSASSPRGRRAIKAVVCLFFFPQWMTCVVEPRPND